MALPNKIDTDPTTFHGAKQVKITDADNNLHQKAVIAACLHLLVPYLKNNVLLDIGCGPNGVVTQKETITTHKAVGIDTSEARIQHARAHHQNPKAEYYVENACSLPFDDRFFGITVLSLILNTLVSPEPVLAEASRVTKENGTMVIAETSITGKRIRQLLAYMIAKFAPTYKFPAQWVSHNGKTFNYPYGIHEGFVASHLGITEEELWEFVIKPVAQQVHKNMTANTGVSKKIIQNLAHTLKLLNFSRISEILNSQRMQLQGGIILWNGQQFHVPSASYWKQLEIYLSRSNPREKKFDTIPQPTTAVMLYTKNTS